MYRIVRLSNKSQVVNSYLDPVVGESEDTVSTMVISYPFQKKYKSFIAAACALDNIKRKGVFTIIKEN